MLEGNAVRRYTLDEAAKKVKISRKTLDDYLLQLRLAKKFGFDFDKHNNDKVGVIRSFVRKKKEEERRRLMDKAKPAPVKAPAAPVLSPEAKAPSRKNNDVR